ncbi:DUF397 domain-containing protein [Streptomyces sp. MW-W600-10]|uniref:DUF397 domain-containing protein n=1 Tax=Streptomyces sp. MW-W600-10 TaxID=2829819 RepID=UPI001C447137|nr:DUF397 domain-containing protein [Streptomyces sp. MW-W600-10]MBV7246893.1 DUF397 domain-containing protein [Streptomyces sp. MW-W600-10]
MVHRFGHWFKSSYSGGTGTECVEVADLFATVGVRDSKRPEGPRITVGRTAWAGFVAGVRGRR